MTTQSRDLIETLFSDDFNLENFCTFISKLFKMDVGEKSLINTEEQWIKDCNRWLSYKKACDVLVIETKKPVQQSRLYHREFIRSYLKSRSAKFALVALYYAKENEWRLSLVEKLYKSSNGEIKEQYTYYKRSSFLAGKRVGTHTIKSRLLPLLQNQSFDVTKLQAAFDIEKVSTEFFNKYVDLYNSIKDQINKQMELNQGLKKYFQSKKIESSDLAKHLLGQIVFLYFIQKKGWFGVQKNKNWGTGDKNFLKEAFNKKYKQYKKNFFNEVLEVLFYDILSKKVDNDFRKNFKCRIPFLNGGLFEPYKNYNHKKFKLKLPNDLFSNDIQTQEGDTGTGILDVFNRYNFTVKEDEPLEKEVAIDPEMLGRIFESLIPENERRTQGAFYTPREIVHYMCEESLIYCLISEFKGKIPKKDIEKFIRHEYNSITKNALPNGIEKNKKIIDKFLKNITICDPAVGSGAFPVAMMLEIIKLRALINDHNFNLYTAKLQCIENSLYGVDNDENSVEIAKLRLWLSLVVDEEKINNIRPLPNLNYKIMQGNSLLGEIKKDSLFHSGLKKLEQLKKRFFKETNSDKKQSYKEKIDSITYSIVGKSKSDSIRFREFSFYVHFSELMQQGGFDIFITNPPYLRHEELKRLQYKPKLSTSYQVYDSKMDIYGYFYERCLELLKQKRISTLITSNKWLRSTYGKNLRKFFEEKVIVNNIIDFKTNKIFSSATVDTNILSVQKQVSGGEYSIPYCDFSLGKFNKSIPIHDQTHFTDYISEGEGKPWFLLNPIEDSIKKQIETKGTPLKNWNNVIFKRGILTGCDNAFIIDTQTKEKLCKEHLSSKKIIKPILRGKDIKKWYYKWERYYIIVTFPSLNFDINKYPAIKKYLKSFGKKLHQTGEEYLDVDGKLKKCRKKTNNKWFELQDSTLYHKEFEKEKIIYPNMTKNVYFTYDKEKMYVNPRGYIITGDPKHLRFIIGQLNSSLIRFFIIKTSPHLQGDTVELHKDKFKEIPLLSIELFEGTFFKKHTDEIIKITSSADYSKNDIKKQKVKNLQKNIDQIIFDLYGLSKNEKDYVIKTIREREGC